VTRLHDLAYGIDLDRIERDVRASATRLTLSRASPKAIFYARPPVELALGTTTLSLGAAEVEVDVTARIYHFGAARLSYAMPITSIAWREFVARVDDIEAMLARRSPWEEDLGRVRELVGPALTRPTEPGVGVDYVFATVRRFDPTLGGDDVLRRLDLVPILTGDTAALAEAARSDVLRHAYSYYASDLVVIGSSRALILEPGGEPDVADILGVAHAQLLELRYYNDLLDAELPLMYDRIEAARRALAGLARRRYASLARTLHTLVAEVTEVSERIDNALVVTEDVYLAKVYGAALQQHRVQDWSTAVDRKLAIIRDAYTALYDEATSARAEYLEIAIVVLILFEIVMAFVL
jgi:hypothetical protein